MILNYLEKEISMKNHHLNLIFFSLFTYLGALAQTNPKIESDENCNAFSFRLHRDNYLLIEKYNREPNLRPYAPYLYLAQGTDLTRNEVAFQLSFKIKFIDNMLGSPLDLWGGYTQQSFWQAYNGKSSRPFRETNYQPEVMAVLPIHFNMPGVTVRFISFGLEHQSNGMLVLFSRSWNRIYGELSLKTGYLELAGRVWSRFGEMQDNPDIYDYMGYGHLSAAYRWHEHILSGLFRYNFRHKHGASQISWAIPIITSIKAYIQYFSGYGQSLIDYNALQKTIAVGFKVE